MSINTLGIVLILIQFLCIFRSVLYSTLTMMTTWVCLMTILLPLAKAQIGVELPEVELPEGTLLGGLRASYSGRVFSSFQGVPYAAPPVGDLRYAVKLLKLLTYLYWVLFK